jgi:peptide methionine sulfoxide reductase MsrA
MELVVKMDGELAAAFAELNPEFQPDEQEVLYLRCLKALYGHIEAARLFYDELNNSLINKMKFTRNRYDPCVYNTQTEDGMVTIKTHVDNLKVSSKAKKQIQEVIDQLKEIYKELTVNEKNIHDYLGMIMEHDREASSLKINMRTYIEGTILGFHD